MVTSGRRGSSSATGSIRLLPRDPGAALTDKALVATAYHAHTARLLARAADVLGHETDRARFDELASQVTAAFNDEFVTPTGRMASDAQTAYALALRFDLLPSEPQRVAPRLGWPSWCAATTTASAPASSARRSCATPWSTPVSSTTPTTCCCRPPARRGCTP